MSMIDASQEISFDTVAGEVEALGQTAIRIPGSVGARALIAQAHFDLGDVRMWTELGPDDVWMICFSTIPQRSGKVSWFAVPAALPTPG